VVDEKEVSLWAMEALKQYTEKEMTSIMDKAGFPKGLSSPSGMPRNQNEMK
jgi:hypothetical protein